MKPLVSIILPNYNHAAFLQERLDSIYNQSYRNFEVLILDDASTDTSLELLTVYKDHPKTAHFILNKKNTGSPFKQWEKGLQLAQGDYVWIAESDDACALNFLETQIAHLEQASVAVAQTKTFNTTGVQKEIPHPVFMEHTETILTNDSLLYCPILNVSATVFKALPKEDVEGFTFTEYSLIGDRVFYYEAFQGKRIVKNEHTTSYFRQEGTGVSNLAQKGIHYLSNYFRQHVSFINYVSDTETLDSAVRKAYIDRFFARVRDRLSRNQKMSFTYAKILWLYYRSR